MTSANIVEYRVEKNNKEVGHHRENIMCHSHFESLLKFVPLSEHTITPYGYDEEEEYWESDTVNLEVFLKKLTIHNKLIKEYFEKKP